MINIMDRMVILQKVIATISGLLITAGIPRSGARILAILYLVSMPLTIQELATLSGYSESTIFSALKLLKERNLVTRLHSRGRALYTPSISLSALITEAHSSIVERARNRLRSIRGEYNEVLGSKIRLLEHELEALIRRLRGEEG